MSSPFCALVLLITNGAHRYKHCPNVASFELFELKRALVYIHLQLRVLFYKYSSSKCKQILCSHYGLDI